MMLQELHITKYFVMFKAFYIICKKQESTVGNCIEDAIHAYNM